MRKFIKISTTICFILLVIIFSFSFFSTKTAVEVLPKDSFNDVLYTGTVYHIFFHSLIIYPELAFGAPGRGDGYKKYMITRDEFQKILPELYKNNFVLIDITSLYEVNPDGTVRRKPLYIPKGKKPLIISLDDLSYYNTMSGHGFAHKLVLDANGRVTTEVVVPGDKTAVTRDGDVVPILDDFVVAHPDFSLGGAKGVIAVTGFEGVLGYRTNQQGLVTHMQDFLSAKRVIDKLKETGWRFASHSYSHGSGFSKGTMSLESLKQDIDAWNKEVRPLVGDTNIFIGPFGQIFKPDDPRRAYLVSRGFKMLCGVGMDLYSHYFSNYVVTDRADIDGYRLTKTPELLKAYFDPTLVIDPIRKFFGK